MPRARQFAQQRLAGQVPEDVVDTVELCVSELATNCVLHASTEFVIRVDVLERGARVSLTDGSPVPPRQVPYGLSAATGRGLSLVANLSSGWGVELSSDGKTVWCEVLPSSGMELDEAALLDAWGDLLDDDEPVDTSTPPAPTPPTPGATIRLLRYPVRRGLRSREHADALVRECMLLRAAYDHGASSVPGRLAALAEMLQSRYSAELSEPERRKLDAFARGKGAVDLDYPRVPQAAEVVEQWRTVIAEMDEYCRQERLLTLSTPPDVAELQRWVFDEFGRQLAGEAPRPWPGPLD